MSNPDALNITVAGMTCEGCATTVDGALTALEGVKATEIDVATGLVRIELDGTVDGGDVEFAADEAIFAAGYKVVSA